MDDHGPAQSGSDVGDNGSVQGYRDDGVVLRTQKLGEADRIITVLTRHHGRVRAVARGVRRTKSRFGARLEPFTHVDVMIIPGRTLDVITQAEAIRAYSRAWDDRCRRVLEDIEGRARDTSAAEALRAGRPVSGAGLGG